MILANELRVGNLVTYNPVAVDEGTLITPLAISCVDNQVGVILDDGFTNCYTWDEILPIPLTPDILEKCSPYLLDWFCEGSFKVVKDESYGWCMKVRNASHTKEIEFGYFKYLHQLQNLYFALTGQELTVNL